MVTWFSFIGFLTPAILIFATALIKMYTDIQSLKIRVQQVDERLTHSSNNGKQRDGIAMSKLNEISSNLVKLQLSVAKLIGADEERHRKSEELKK